MLKAVGVTGPNRSRQSENFKNSNITLEASIEIHMNVIAIIKRFCVVLCMSLCWGALSQAASYPANPVRIIVPFPPGGNTDMVARLMADELSRHWGKPVVVENRPGAGGTLGTGHVAKQAPDGYTLLVPSSGAITTAPSIYPKISYQPLRDFVYITPLTFTPNVLLVNPKLPVANVKELLAYAGERPGTLNYSSPGIGLSDHLGMELLLTETGIKVVHVPYRGSAEARVALMAGEVHMTFATLGAAIPQVLSGALKPLAVSGSQRSPALPHVPTLAESGFPDLVVYTWTGLVAPAGTHPETVTEIRRAALTVLEQPHIRKNLAETGSDVFPMSPTEFKKFVASETKRWDAVVRQAGVKVDVD